MMIGCEGRIERRILSSERNRQNLNTIEYLNDDLKKELDHFRMMRRMVFLSSLL